MHSKLGFKISYEGIYNFKSKHFKTEDECWANIFSRALQQCNEILAKIQNKEKDYIGQYWEERAQKIHEFLKYCTTK